MKEKLIKQGGITIIQLVLIVVVIVIVISIIKWGKIFNRKDEKVGKEEESMQTVMQEENVGKLENGTKMNTSAKLAEEKEVAGLKVTGIQLTKNETWSKIIATVKNEGNIEEGNFTVEIDVKDKDGKVLTTLPGYIGKIEAGGEVQLNVSTMEDISNAYDIELRKK